MAKNRPYNPAAAARAALQAQERKDREAEIQRLEGQGAIVVLDHARRIISARRSNVFTLLLARGSITQNHHNAAYRLAETWAVWKGLDGKSEADAGFVDGGSGCAELVTDRMIAAGKVVAAILAMLPELERRVIEAFMVATVEEDRPMAWRGVVERETGCSVRDRQTAVVVEALENLRRVYEAPREKQQTLVA